MRSAWAAGECGVQEDAARGRLEESWCHCVCGMEKLGELEIVRRRGRGGELFFCRKTRRGQDGAPGWRCHRLAAWGWGAGIILPTCEDHIAESPAARLLRSAVVGCRGVSPRIGRGLCWLLH